MKAIMPIALPDVLALHKRTGADRWHEMWDGVLHMPPFPTTFQQDLEATLETFLRLVWVPLSGGKAYHQINVASVGSWPNDYRIPDIVIMLPERFGIDHNEYFEGGPNAVVEFHCPGDEAYDKLPFYAAVGVRDVWIINRDTCNPEVFRLAGKRYQKVEAGADGWLRSKEIGVELRRVDGKKLAIRLAGDEASRQDLPHD